MAEEDDTPSAAESTGAPRQKRPPVTIDLEAEAVAPAHPAEPSHETAAEARAEPPPAAAEDPATAPDSALRRYLPLGVAAVIGGLIGGAAGALLFAPQTDTITSASIDSRFATLASRLDALEAKSGNGTAAAPAIDPERITALESGLARLESQQASAGEGAPVDLQPIELRLAALEARPVETPTPAVDLQPLEQKLSALDGRIGEIEAHPPSDPATEAAARTIALTALRQAARSDRPFDAELAAFRTLGGDEPQLAALAPLAANGAPSVASLQASFPAAADAVRSASRRIDPEAGFIDRLAASAGSLVSVKPAGPVEGSSPTAIVSRMESMVDKGDLAAALAESDTLDATSKSALAGWADAARRRVAIDTALAALAGN
ncbi:MAG TPA: mitofilin family membrane protein [Kaistia sp.]|nr:mitofilin family membrane protein [Kaistia sp.]